MRVRIVDDIMTTDETGTVVESIPVSVAGEGDLDSVGRPAGATAAELSDQGLPVRFASGPTSLNSIGNLVEVLPLSGILVGWFVDGNVSSSGDGSIESPWKEFTDIDWDVVHPGDTIWISGGPSGLVYTSALVWGKSGEAGSPIKLTRRPDSGHNGVPSLDGGNSGICIDTDEKNYLIIEKLRALNTDDACIYVDGATAGVIVQDCAIVAQGPGGGNARGIDIRHCDGALAAIIRRNTIMTAGNSTDQTDCIYAQDNDGIAIRANRCAVSNQDSTGHSDCIQLYDCGDVEVSANWCEQSNGRSDNHGIWASDTRTGKTYSIFNNVVWMRGLAAESGITHFNENDPQWTGKALIDNNTVVGGLAPINIDRSSSQSRARNNILIAKPGYPAVKIANLTPAAGQFDHNLVDTGSSLVLSAPTAATIGGARSSTSKTTGAKAYWEIRLGPTYAGGNSGAGIANATQNLTAFLGAGGNNSAGYYASSGRIYINGGFTTTIQTAAAGDVIAFALDVSNGKLWIKNLTAASGWNNDIIGNQNPTTNTGGKDISAITGPYFIGQSLSSTNDAVTLNAGASAFVGAIPSGFTAWGAGVVWGAPQAPASISAVAMVGSTAKTWTSWKADSQEANGVNADPLFADRDGGDFTLAPSSPGLDVGETIASVPEDYAGNARPRGAGYDIGAFERAA